MSAAMALDARPAGLSLPDALAEGLRLLRAVISSSGELRGAETVGRAGSEIDLLRRRDQETWRQFFDAEMPAIYRYALSRLGSPGDAEDIASRVFEEAWEHAHTLEDRGLPARAWLFGIARNVVGSHRRSWLRRPQMLALESFDGPTTDTGLDPELIDLARAIARLERSHAEVISLRFVNGLSLQEAASVLGISVDAVKARQARALARLREIMRTRQA